MKPQSFKICWQTYGFLDFQWIISLLFHSIVDTAHQFLWKNWQLCLITSNVLTTHHLPTHFNLLKLVTAAVTVHAGASPYLLLLLKRLHFSLPYQLTMHWNAVQLCLWGVVPSPSLWPWQVQLGLLWLHVLVPWDLLLFFPVFLFLSLYLHSPSAGWRGRRFCFRFVSTLTRYSLFTLWSLQCSRLQLLQLQGQNRKILSLNLQSKWPIW